MPAIQVVRPVPGYLAQIAALKSEAVELSRQGCKQEAVLKLRQVTLTLALPPALTLALVLALALALALALTPTPTLTLALALGATCDRRSS